MKDVLLGGMPWAAMYMQIQGASLSVYLVECVLLAELYSGHKSHRSKHNPSFMDQNTQFRIQLKPFGSYKQNHIYYRKFVDTRPFIDRFICNYA